VVFVNSVRIDETRHCRHGWQYRHILPLIARRFLLQTAMKTSIATSPAGRKSAKGSQVRPVGLLAGLVSSIVPLWYPHERLVRLLNGRIGFCRIPRAGCQAAPINRRWPLWGRMTSSYSPRPPRQRSRRVEDDEERYDTEICARPYFVRLGL